MAYLAFSVKRGCLRSVAKSPITLLILFAYRKRKLEKLNC
jgi:hypothetical protein